MTEQVRVGMVGTSWWADLMYLPESAAPSAGAARRDPRGRNAQRAAEMADAYVFQHVFTDYQDHDRARRSGWLAPAHYLWRRQMICITRSRSPQSMLGDMVPCEKPLALSAAPRPALTYERAEEAGVVHINPLSTYRFLPHIRYLHQLLADFMHWALL